MSHSTERRIGVLLGQVGTPEAPTKKAVHTYLRQFLSDPRVIDLHPFLWKPILYGIVLLRRPAISARMYDEIWMPDGSPLMVYSQRLIAGLQERLGDGYAVELGMAYGEPSIPAAVSRLEKEGIERVVTLPLFPQFSTATTASIYDEVYAAVSGRRWDRIRIKKKHTLPTTFLGAFYDHPAYKGLLASHIRKYVAGLPETPDKFILTFHGLPKRYTDEGDPYEQQCLAMARSIAEEMGWNTDDWTYAFQSRFGRQAWLQPYAEPLIRSLPPQGISRPCIIPLSFVTDCLETVHELNILYRKAFVEAGGVSEHYFVMPCLNDDPAWLDFLASLIRGEI